MSNTALILFQKNESQKFIAPIDKHIIYFNPLENELRDFRNIYGSLASGRMVTSEARVNVQRNLDGNEAYTFLLRSQYEHK